uniref:titin isoform X2 n=1 Tax=Epinephelus lanceolatus TaxID=310571 RepID=UPI0014460AB9|nr:titin isoform X2 [Epinephelus lanceolatus]
MLCTAYFLYRISLHSTYMTQPRSTASSCAARWKMWLVKVLGVIYLTAVCAAQDQEDATTVAREFAPTDPTPMTMSIGTVYVPPEPSVQLLSGWTEVFLSEKVEFSCNVDGSSDWTFTWYRDEQQVQDSDPNVSIEGSKLTITAASDAQSGSYSCKGHHKTKSGVITGTAIPIKLKVHANKPKPSLTQDSNTEKMFLGESVTFTCKVTESSGWNYLWYHNGNEIQAADSTAHTIGSIDHPDSGRYHCKAKRGKDQFFTEESDTKTLQVFDQPRPSVKMVSPWLEVFENETLAFSCEVDINDDWTYTWYKNKEVVLEDMNTDKVDSYLNITGITRASQGDYTCGVQVGTRRRSSGISNATHITVYENTPKPTLTKVPAFNPMYVGETVTFTCKVDVSSGWKYQWYRDRRVLKHTSETISIRLGLSDQGKYLCTATRDEMTSTDFSEEIPQDVLEIPLPSLKLETKWSDVFPDESVKLNCGMNSISDWTYTWEKGGQQVQADGVVSFNSNGATLDIRSAAATHAGEYHCKGHLMGRSVKGNSSSGLTLSVYDKKPRLVLTQDPDYKVMFPGESVSFTCHINVSSGWEYLWFKDGSLLTVPGNKYSISSVGSTNSGLYTCQVKRGTDRVFFTEGIQPIRLQVEGNKPKPSMTQSPNADKVFTGELVSFECKVALSSGWKYLWYKDEAQLSMNSSIFTIRDAIVSNSGTYKCVALRDKTTYSTEFSDTRALRVSEIPVPILKLETPWSDVFPTESVKLSCDMDRTSDWKYTWSKDGRQVQAENSVFFKSDGAILSIDSASSSHHGRYKCLGELKSRPVKSIFSSEQTLDVYDTKPRVTLMQNPTHDVMHSGDSVSFSCHTNVSSGWEYLWYKDGTQITESGNNYTITPVATSNTGSYQCLVRRIGSSVFLSDKSQAARLEVKERPQADIVLLTGWSEVFSTDSLVLRCGVQENPDMWNYTWFKEGQRINQPLTEKHTVTPQNDPEQSLYTCQGVSNGRPSYSKISESFKTKNLLLKRRVLLSISGCIFFGIIAVFIGCIFLRIFHKPADDDEKPEDTELFPTMAQLKDRDDAACPLVKYITDAELRASPKEAEENGTICSETTPLPITSQEDQAVTSENHDTTENNSGLVSFKQ